MTVSIIIVNYRTDRFTLQCIESINLQCNGENFEIIVVDNGSETTSFKNYLLQKKIKYINSGSNLGFGNACNIGAEAAAGEVLLFVNPDVTFNGNLLKNLKIILDQSEKNTILGFNLNDGNGKATYSSGHFPSITTEFFELLMIDKIFKSFYKPFRLAQVYAHQKNKIINVDFVSGALFGIRSDTFKKLNGFNKNIFLYFEETELMYRHRQSGGNVLLLLDVMASHIGSVSTNENSDFKIRHMELGRYIFYTTRYTSSPKFFTVVFLRCLKLIKLSILKQRFIYLKSLPFFNFYLKK